MAGAPGEGGDAPDLLESVAPEAAEAQEALEAEARHMGWRPEAEFKGDPKTWIDAQTFLTRGKEVLPLVKAENRKLRREIDDIRATMAEFKDHHAKVKERAFQDAMAHLKKLKSDAVTRGDGEAFDAIEAEQDRLRVEQDRAAVEVQASGEGTRELESWKEANPWYGVDPAMTRTVDLMAQGLRAAHPNAHGREILKQLDIDIKEAFPHKFGKKRTEQNVDTGAPASAPQKGARSYANLPADARKQCDKWVKEKLLTREQYIAEYKWED